MQDVSPWGVARRAARRAKEAAKLETEKRTKAMSKMSHDRVHFTIPGKFLERESYRNCIFETLGIPTHELKKCHPHERRHYESDYLALKIICRPSQFARFIILRHVKYGEPNNMAPLDMQLVKPEREEGAAVIIDTSGRIDRSTGAP